MNTSHHPAHEYHFTSADHHSGWFKMNKCSSKAPSLLCCHIFRMYLVDVLDLRNQGTQSCLVYNAENGMAAQIWQMR